MGHRKQHAPHHGSLSYLPRKRSSRPWGRVRSWPSRTGEPIALGFAGYKAGMTHAILLDNAPHSPLRGREVEVSATIIDCPPLAVCGLRAYAQTPYGLRCSHETWSKNLSKDLSRSFPLPSDPKTDEKLGKLEAELKSISRIRLLVHTQPRLAAVSSKKPVVAEIEVGGGPIQDQFKYAKNLLGKEIRIRDVFREGGFLDVIGVSKGKGYQGVVKRYHVKVLQKKSRKTVRGVGTLGPISPHSVMYTIPRSGQLGYHHRVEFNKRILKLGDRGEEITAKGGINRYGIVRGDFLLLEGSVPGDAKRLLKLRLPIRLNQKTPEAPAQILHIHNTPKK
ncbi:MAG: 50S ribosomal protein L3 [Promethearchaeati archaeon SRVP18_Atabeyarchaeia-1]